MISRWLRSCIRIGADRGRAASTQMRTRGRCSSWCASTAPLSPSRHRPASARPLSWRRRVLPSPSCTPA